MCIRDRTTKRYGLSEKQNQPVRIIVIYTGSIRRGTTRADVDMGCLQFTVEEVFLSDLDAQEIETRFQRKIHSGEILSDEEQMQLSLIHIFGASDQDLYLGGSSKPFSLLGISFR